MYTHNFSTNDYGAPEPFDMRNHLNKLTPAKENNKYLCPVCDDDNFGVSPENGAYQCWGNGCSSADIRQAVSPSQKSFGTANRPQRRQKSAKDKEHDAAINASQIETRVEEFVIQVREGILREAEARISLETWCKEEGYSFFNAGKRFDEKLEELPPNEFYSPSKYRLSPDELREELKQLRDKCLSGSELEINLTEFAKSSGVSISQVKRIWDLLCKEAEQTAEVPIAANNLQHVQQIKLFSLAISEGLHGDGGVFAKKIMATAKAMQIPPEYLVVTLIPVAAVAMGTAQTLMIKAKGRETACPIFQTLIVGDTGSKKSPAQKLIVGVLADLEKDSKQEHDAAVKLYDSDRENWQRLKESGEDPGPEPLKPVRRRYMAQDVTPESLFDIHSQNPRGLLVYCDEASSFVTRRGRYKSGKGDGGELEMELALFDGKFAINDRKGDGNKFLDKVAISKTGSIQPSVLARLLGDQDDERGEWARFLVCCPDAPKEQYDFDDDDFDIGLTEDLKRFIITLYKMPESTYVLSPEAKDVYKCYRRDLMSRKDGEDHCGLRNAYPKFVTYFGRFILWLHVFNAVLAGQTPAPSVDAKTVSLAQQWTEYFIGQLQVILTRNDSQQPLTGDLLRVYEYMQRKGEALTPSKISTGRIFCRDKDQSKHGTAYIRKLLSILVTEGYVTEEDGRYEAKPLR